MGKITFLVHAPNRLGVEALKRIHVCGLDDIPWRCSNSWSEEKLIVDRPVSDSGRVVVPWVLEGIGEMALQTATLIERPKPYLLELELARGMLNEARNHAASLELAGLTLSETSKSLLKQCIGKFANAATSQSKPERSAEISLEVIENSVSLSTTLSAELAEQAIQIRRRAAPKLPTLLGIHLGQRAPGAKIAGDLAGAFNLAEVPFYWRSIEPVEGEQRWSEPDNQIAWCQKNRMKISGGPLLHLDDHSIPDWMYLWENDPESLASFMLDHVREVVKRYRGRVHFWQAMARCNGPLPLGLQEEQALQIAVRAVEAIRELDPKTPVVMLFDQPWSEYMAEQDYDLTAFQFADVLVRADIGVAGVGLEINTGYWPGGTLSRSTIAFSRLIDQWSALGVPIVLSLQTPSSSFPDDIASTHCQVPASADLVPLSQATQRTWIEQFIPIAISKQAVQVVIWNQLDDGLPHEFPHGGLFDRDGEPKEALQTLRAIRQKYLL